MIEENVPPFIYAFSNLVEEHHLTMDQLKGVLVACTVSLATQYGEDAEHFLHAFYASAIDGLLSSRMVHVNMEKKDDPSS